MIRFDHRERTLLVRWKGPKRVEDLPLGDIIVGNVLIERKAEGDFAEAVATVAGTKIPAIRAAYLPPHVYYRGRDAWITEEGPLRGVV